MDNSGGRATFVGKSQHRTPRGETAAGSHWGAQWVGLGPGGLTNARDRLLY